MEIDNCVKTITEYCQYHNDEYSEMVNSVVELYNCKIYLSNDLIAKLEKEIKEIYDYYIDNFELVEQKETITRTHYELIEK